MSIFIRRRLLLGALAFGVLCGTGWWVHKAYGQDDSEYSRSTLQGLKGVVVLVEGMHPEAERDGLTRRQIQTDVELRLRKAGITVLTEKQFLQTLGKPYLYVRVNTFKGGLHGNIYALSTEVRLVQSVRLSRDTRIQQHAATWSAAGMIGMVGSAKLQGAGKESVAEKVDQFINAYLAANPKRSSTP